jgi:hypothetical protein
VKIHKNELKSSKTERHRLKQAASNLKSHRLTAFCRLPSAFRLLIISRRKATKSSPCRILCFSKQFSKSIQQVNRSVYASKLPFCSRTLGVSFLALFAVFAFSQDEKTAEGSLHVIGKTARTPGFAR